MKTKHCSCLYYKPVEKFVGAFYDGAYRNREYIYDYNGNLRVDENRGIREMEYNVFNLPTKIRYTSDRWSEYFYDGKGHRLESVLLEYRVDEGPDPVSLEDVEVSQGVASPYATIVCPRCWIDLRKYAGCFELRAGSELRAYTPSRYFDNKGAFYVYIHDYQCDIKTVMRADVSTKVPVQRNNYYPYGLPTAEGDGADENDYLYGGKEFDTRNGVNVYDFGARTYAPDIARFWQPDPMAHDYHWLSPYAYCGGDPVNRIDPDGKNIAILLVDGMVGHLGMLIQKEDGSWAYYSVNETPIYELTGGNLGGGPTNDVGTGSWSSPQEFMNEAHDTTDDERKFNPECINNYAYTEAYEIETTLEQDKIIAKEFSKIANERYDLIFNNCAHAVQRSLRKGGIIPYYSPRAFVPTNIGYSISLEMPLRLYVQPQNAYNYIKEQNPHGKTIRKGN